MPEASEIFRLPLMDLSSVSVGPAENATFTMLGDYDPPPYWEYTPVRVWVVADEEFRSKNYETTWFQSVGWEDYVKSVVERSDDRLYEQFGIDLCIVSVGAWQSDNTKYGDALFDDVLAKTGFKTFETCINGQVINVLIAFTGQYLGYCAGAIEYKRVIMMQYNVYWADDNVLRHEVSHLFGAHDHIDGSDPCYFEDCVMSYRKVPIEYWTEDGWVWYVGNTVSLAAISNNWCSECQSTIRWKQIYFLFPRCVSNHFYMWR
jgi:hypothetical protein